MFPGMNLNPKMMRQAMKKLGMEQSEIEAVEVIIKTKDKELVFPNPSVAKINAMGQETYQITGEAYERERGSTAGESAAISDDDIKTVMEQAGVSKEKAERALRESKGDIAGAILKLKE